MSIPIFREAIVTDYRDTINLIDLMDPIKEIKIKRILHNQSVASEEFNDKNNVIERTAFGFRDLDRFILKIRSTYGSN